MDKIEEVLTRGVAQILPSKEGLKRLIQKGKIKLYLGIDPSTSQLHLGHTVVLRKLRDFQQTGHEVILLVGDFTGRVGDPSEKTSMRKKLTHKQVLENAKTYKEQASKILNFSGKNQVKIKFNSQWLDKLTFKNLIEIASVFTVQQFIERDMFQERIKKKKPIGIHEFLYPLMQAYDSLAMDVDLEVGGTDQIFNMLTGRTLMKAIKGKEKFVLAVPLLIGTDGRKMGKSLRNFIPITDSPEEMYGKIMSLKDELILQYFKLCTDVSLQLIKVMEKDLKAKKVNPMELKKKLAFEIVSMYHGKIPAKNAEKQFERVFQKRKLPTKVKTVKLKTKDWNIVDLFMEAKLTSSRAEAKRIISQGGVDINGIPVLDIGHKVSVKDGMVIRCGKRKFIRLKTRKS